MKVLLFSLVLLPFVLNLLQDEVPHFEITPKAIKYEDFTFQVGFEPMKLYHRQFQIYDIVISIRHQKRKNVNPEGYVEIWDGRRFVFSCSVPQAGEDALSVTLKKKIETRDAMLFFFLMNPGYIEESRFIYQVRRDDGSAEINCVIRLKDFIKVAPAENLISPTGD